MEFSKNYKKLVSDITKLELKKQESMERISSHEKELLSESTHYNKIVNKICKKSALLKIEFDSTIGKIN